AHDRTGSGVRRLVAPRPPQTRACRGRHCRLGRAGASERTQPLLLYGSRQPVVATRGRAPRAPTAREDGPRPGRGEQQHPTAQLPSLPVTAQVIAQVPAPPRRMVDDLLVLDPDGPALVAAHARAHLTLALDDAGLVETTLRRRPQSGPQRGQRGHAVL